MIILIFYRENKIYYLVEKIPFIFFFLKLIIFIKFFNIINYILKKGKIKGKK
jgi:hypothetical protein